MNTVQETNSNQYTAFWPLCLLALSIGILLGWQVLLAGQQYISLQRMAEQQAVTTQQAAQAESKLQAIMMDLVELSQSNKEALAIVKKYGIKVTPPAQTGASDQSPLPKSPAAGRPIDKIIK